jgi:hypothetical protein
MDGKFRVLAGVAEVTAAAREGRPVKEVQSVEVPYGVLCIEHFEVGDKELMVTGLCDGTI